MAVDVVEGEAGGAERGELGADLGGEPAPRPGPEEEAEAGGDLVAGKAPVAADQAGKLGRRQDRHAVDEDEVEPDRQPRQAPRPRHRIGRGGGRHHQAGAGQDAVAIGALDRLVDRTVAAEIVGTDDQPAAAAAQLAISRWRRNWKNSMPSRSRRRIICGLFSISATRAAIFWRRK